MVLCDGLYIDRMQVNFHDCNTVHILKGIIMHAWGVFHIQSIICDTQ